jgi:amino acid permease
LFCTSPTIQRNPSLSTYELLLRILTSLGTGVVGTGVFVGIGTAVVVGNGAGAASPFITSGRYTTLFVRAKAGMDSRLRVRSAARRKPKVR